MSDTPPPVLILAARESGGSLLSSLLGMHSGFCGAPHLNVLAFEAFWQLAQYAVHPALIALAKDKPAQAAWRQGLRLPRRTRYQSRAERGLIAFLEAEAAAEDQPARAA